MRFSISFCFALFSMLIQAQDFEFTVSEKDSIIARGYNRKLNGGIVQTDWHFIKGKKVMKEEIVSLSIQDTVFYKQSFQYAIDTSTEDWRRYRVPLVVDVDSAKLLVIKNAGWEFNTEHLSIGNSRYVFGTYCNVAAEPTDGFLWLKRVIKMNDTETLRLWLRSVNPIFQAFGYMGLKDLKNKGLVTLSSSDFIAMRALSSSDLIIPHCSGCTYGGRKLNEILSPTSVKGFLRVLNR